MSSDRAIRVTAGTVSLKLTLTPKLLKRSLTDAVINPFIKAYNKKMCHSTPRAPVPAQHPRGACD